VLKTRETKDRRNMILLKGGNTETISMDSYPIEDTKRKEVKKEHE